MGHNIRKIVAKRLRSEAKRKQFKPTSIASDAGLSYEVVDGYLKGKRELRWGEFVSICRAVNVTPMWLISADYQPSDLVYRNALANARREFEQDCSEV